MISRSDAAQRDTVVESDLADLPELQMSETLRPALRMTFILGAEVLILMRVAIGQQHITL